MEDKICIILPTLKRLEEFKTFADSWVKTTNGKSVVIVGIDDNDDTYNELIQEKTYPFIYMKITPKPLLYILNEISLIYAKKYKYLSLMEDDLIIHTPGWESKIIDKLKELGDTAWVWTNTLSGSDSKQLGVPFIHSDIVNKLGYFANPGYKSHYTDNHWLDLAKKLKTFHYFEDIIIEHTKKTGDSTYNKVRSNVSSDGTFYGSDQRLADLEWEFKKLTGE